MASYLCALSCRTTIYLCVVFVTIVRIAPAVTIEWQQPGGGDLTVGGNWQGGVAPTPVDDALFALAGVNSFFATTNLTYNSALFSDGDNSLTMGSSTLTLNDVLTLGDTTTPVSLSFNSGDIAVNGLFTTLGAVAGSDASFTLDGAMFSSRYSVSFAMRLFVAVGLLVPTCSAPAVTVEWQQLHPPQTAHA